MLKIAWAKNYNHPLPPNHRFPMIKYDLLREQLLYEGTVAEENFFTPELIDRQVVLATHNEDYVEKLHQLRLSRSEVRRTGFPLSYSLVERELLITSGTVRCTQFALDYGISMNIAGGTHHAFTDRGEGFCLLNDQAVAANYLLANRLASKILIIDLDVHQGNGTAEIFGKEPNVFTFSMHGVNNYPLHKEKSDLDVELNDGTTDDEYLFILQKHLKILLKRLTPDFVFFQSGVDVLSSDKLGRLGLTLNGCKQRDYFVLDTLQKAGIPVVVTMGGGYSSKLSHIIEAHANTYRAAQELFF
ncbi:histone deacetylase family protein [Marinoscillum furvescens]|uniref:Acetoin utilization deacetylase AcuC-like enzyme n=1 Tax=Marinoscillum furvescens DSM 4134 TaxID=1122208 RepID=A0A3D9LA41_MARFU|nr:histone deacetylase [Marinoscillum furvescens]REE02123.1 acetoin utilization deacetylase AcuC-like enzyme [Marinoscillum furvescens DSM 4134]